MSIIALASNTLAGSPGSGQIEYDGQFYATDSNSARGQLERITRGTAVSASGTSVDFTGIPAWAKKITVMFSGVSTSGTSLYLIQLGSGTVVTTGYNTYTMNSNGSGFTSNTNGFVLLDGVTAASNVYGLMVFDLISSNTWISSGNLAISGANKFSPSAGVSAALSGALDRVRITTVNGTDTFDAGTINVMWEG